MDSYENTCTVKSDKKKTEFPPGSTITGKDFPVRVIKNWLSRGILVKMLVEETKEMEAENGSDTIGEG